ncbi:acyltransferase family protein [Litorisediminicola beolgyonensis]|uniref:Acyltransferase family protein n=1 Tax=Litorisediminicola beolgyonensis TaxID=1173614 RepID=A0ABW3ZK65_9RHOB
MTASTEQTQPSLGAALDAAGGRPAGFDYLRLGLALSVVLVHSFTASVAPSDEARLWAHPLWGSAAMALLPMFFALSGFLVAGSMARTPSVGRFLGLRALRIYPALAVEVLLTALILGPFFTTLPFDAYLSDPGFARYLVNVTGHVTITLPGVFETNPRPFEANAQLWTVPFELYCYIALALLMLCGAARDPRVLFWGAALVFALVLLRIGARTDWRFPDYRAPVAGWMLVVSFLLGVGLYQLRHAVPAGRWAILAAGVATLAIFAWCPGGRILGCLPASYLAVALGTCNPARGWVVAGADYSYGIFLYHFAILQAVIALTGGGLGWPALFVLWLGPTALCAALSWHLVERPILSRKSAILTWRPRWRLRA